MLDPVIVLGMHRSGTSLLTGCLQAAGLYLGDVNDSAPFNRKGNKENESIRRLHDDILSRLGHDWKRPPTRPVAWTENEKARLKELLEPYRHIERLWGIKDPRTVWLLDHWLDLFPGAHLVGVFRHPSLVVDSLGARPGVLGLPSHKGIELWKITNRRILALHERFGFPLLYFSEPPYFEETFLDPLQSFCQHLGLNGNPRIFFDLSLVNHKRINFELSSEVMKLYDRLVNASVN